MTILLITYDISPYRGSEASVSWNYVSKMRLSHQLVVLYGRCKDEVEGYLRQNDMRGVAFVNVPFVEVSGSGLLINVKYNLNYRKWHKVACLMAVDLMKRQKIDVIHYLNPIGFKEPGYCWRIKGVPYVWGPVQGVENRPLCLYRALGVSGVVDALVRLIAHNGMLLFSPRVRRAVKRADCVFAATPNTVRQMRRVFGKETIYLPENGILKMNRTEPVVYKSGEVLRIVWCGAVCYRKGLIILLDALRKVKSVKWCLNVIGGGNLLSKLKDYADKTGIGKNITWHGSIPREQVFRLMADSHLHVISSLGDATTTVLLEAMSFAVPTMTLDHCGMAGVVCPKCGIKIPIYSYNQVVNDMATNIEGIINEPERINHLSRGVIECSKKYLLENRIGVFDKVYEEVKRMYE